MKHFRALSSLKPEYWIGPQNTLVTNIVVPGSHHATWTSITRQLHFVPAKISRLASWTALHSVYFSILIWKASVTDSNSPTPAMNISGESNEAKKRHSLSLQSRWTLQRRPVLSFAWLAILSHLNPRLGLRLISLPFFHPHPVLYHFQIPIQEKCRNPTVISTLWPQIFTCSFI